MTELIVALDQPRRQAAETYDRLKDRVKWFKIGVPALLDGGESLAWNIVYDHNRLMLDLKLYDTRDTVVRAIEQAEALRADMVTVHATAVRTAHKAHTLVKILAVGGLTDGSGVNWGLDDAARFCGGLVCPPLMAPRVREIIPSCIIVCPGIRYENTRSDNHRLPITPVQAKQSGADFIVVGRPIYNAPDPLAVALQILGEIA